VTGAPGFITAEAPAKVGVTPDRAHTFTAAKPGTYTHYSGRPDLQVEMGLVGAIIGEAAGYVAGNPGTIPLTTFDSRYDREFLLLSEMMKNSFIGRQD
jgi:FtsP/CotA-like multicopper oxidase with cupredoxin domain